MFESGWFHFADGVASYRAAPDYVKAWLRDVPNVWDDIKFISGTPGQSVILARRHGTDWYVAGINGTTEPRAEKVSLRFLPPGDWRVTQIGDGDGSRAFQQQQCDAPASDVLNVTMQPRGGFVAVLHKAGK